MDSKKKEADALSEKQLKRRDFLKHSSVIAGGAWFYHPLRLFLDSRPDPAAGLSPPGARLPGGAGQANVGAATKKRIDHLIGAFGSDGFAVDPGSDVFIYTGRGNERIGIRAHSRIAANYQTGEKKAAYYVEGSSYEMGVLIGWMAAEKVAVMTRRYIDKLVLSFVHIKTPKVPGSQIVKIILESIFKKWEKWIRPDMPAGLTEEMDGIVDGCLMADPPIRINPKHVGLLNTAFDAILAHVYTGSLFKERRIQPEHLNVPVTCNAFSISGQAAAAGHYFGRDFMFHDADVFQDTACLILYRPDPEAARSPLLVSMTAPGMVGSVTAMNAEGVAMGLDMLPLGICDPKRPGFNSMLLVRHCIQNSASAAEAAELVTTAQRGVSWLYPVADAGGRAGVIEAGMSMDLSEDEWIRYALSFPEKKYAAFLPDAGFLRGQLRRFGEEDRKRLLRGVMIRWSDYRYPREYIDRFNPDLWKRFNQEASPEQRAVLYPDAFADGGFINKNYLEKNCPASYYFAPQREANPDLVWVSNHAIIPEMRLFGMTPWLARMTLRLINDIQWRFDALNAQIRSALAAGPIREDRARQIIDFLAPYGPYPEYYLKTGQRSSDGLEFAINGSVSLFDLKNRVVQSHYGYYCDEWVRITLPRYKV